ncbi:CIA30 family protein [Bizionia gelidisalsuginis]|uniref:CIA30 family protein n=2 Tax=Bizionia TaxID=283785 RepID=A0A8H2LDB8_9FLAO|nr:MULTISPECIES: CIA30 family protein [Bizionia]TYB72651.1 CIA30 family protein [Bizionia saleffrena]TYC18108.1 CIA30 family protein [Bizionia gelidisalsuginis]
MKLLLYIIILTTTQTMAIIFNFNTSSNITNWRVVDDVVMGGRSNGTFSLNKDGNGVFTGSVSLKNNGGFSSLRFNTEKTSVEGFSNIVLRLRGDGKTYQFRVKTKATDVHSYITTFKTSGEWEDISIPLKDLYPSFRGRTLEMTNFSAESFEEIGFLIGNKREESFTLFLDSIRLQ